MALTAANVITRAQDTIQDQTGVRWPEAELLRYLNDGRREICILRPDVYAVVAAVSLVSGTKQSIPADGNRLLDVIRNASGNAIRIVEREILDAQMPDWHTQTAAATKHFMFDERTPRVFYVYPPAVGAASVDIAYAKSPTDITNTADPLTEEDLFAPALVDYVCFRAFSKDAEYAGNTQRAQAHYAQFANTLGVGARVTLGASPNTANVGGQPPRVGATGG